MEDDTPWSAATVTPATGGGRSARRNKRDRSERDTGSVVVVSGGSKNHDTEGSILDSTTTTTVPGGVASTSGSLVASVDSVDNGNDAIGNGVNDDDVVDGNGDGGKVKCPKKVAGGRRGKKMKQEVVKTSDQTEINHKVKISGRSNSSDSNGDLGEMGSREVNVEITMNGDIDELSTKHRLQATMNGVATSRCGDLEHDQQQQQQKDTGTEGQNNEETILGNAAAATLQAEESNLPSPSSLDENEPSPKTPSSTTTSPPLLPTTNTKGSKYCAHESCTKYRQTGCYGYCLTHKLIADPNMHAIKRNIAEHNSDMKKRTLNKSNLCKWPSCTKYIQSNCNGYCLTHVKYANYEEGDVYDVTKVRVRIGSRLQNGFCRAILPLELRRQWGFDVAGGGGGMNSGEGICGETSSPMGETPGKIMGGVGGDTNVSDENVEANNTSGDDVGDSSNQFQNDRMLAISPEISNGTPKRRTVDGSISSQAISLGGANDDMEMETADDIIFGLTPEGGFRSQRTYVPPEHIAQLSLTPNLKEGGRSICKMIGCGKLDQSNNDGFCRMHFHMFEVREKSDDDWTCGCGLLMAGSQKRCGVCCRWKGGKREAPEFIKSETTSTSEDVQDDGEIWTCECGNKIASDKTRCGNCRHWRGGRRQGGWTLGTGKDYDSDDGIDRTQDWTCCGGTIPAKQTRCGKCNGWRGGKRVYSNAAEASPPLNLPPWVCFKCQMSNPGNKKRCGGCLSWKSSGAPATSKPSRGSRKNAGNRGSTDEIDPNAGGHWKCVSCNFDNFSRELSCFICQSMRPNHQWHKKQQLINSIPASSTQHTAETAATNSKTTAAVLNANPAAEAAPLGPVHASTVSIAGGSTTNNQGATANGNDVSVVDTISNPPDTMNYYGTFNESLIYPYISIHYDFNRAYYYNHDYTYLNAGVGSIRDDSGGDDGTSFAEKTNND